MTSRLNQNIQKLKGGDRETYAVTIGRGRSAPMKQILSL